MTGSEAHGHVAPAEHHLAFLFDHAFELLLAGLAGGGLPRQKDHADAIVAGRREFDTERCHFLTIKRIRNLNQNARTVTAQGIGTDGAAMIKIVKDEQSIFNDLVRYMSLDIGHKADTAGVVLGIRTIQAFCGSLLPHGLRTSHGVLPFVRVFCSGTGKLFFSAPRKAPNRCFIWLSGPSFLTVSKIKNAAIKELVA